MRWSIGDAKGFEEMSDLELSCSQQETDKSRRRNGAVGPGLPAKLHVQETQQTSKTRNPRQSKAREEQGVLLW